MFYIGIVIGILIATFLIWGTLTRVIPLIRQNYEGYEELDIKSQKEKPSKRRSRKKKKTNKKVNPRKRNDHNKNKKANKRLDVISKLIRRLLDSIQIHFHF